MKCKVQSPFGNIWITGNRDYLTSVSWDSRPDAIPDHAEELDWFAGELKQYLSGNLINFTGGLSYLNMTPVWERKSGTKNIPDTLQASVMKIMSDIPYGATKTYGSIAGDAGNKRYARAVGRICGVNPLAIIVPCHRVVAANSIGGYSAGLDRKRYLLNIEGLVL